MDKPVILRRLITKDGIKGPIEERDFNGYEEIRAGPLDIRITTTAELELNASEYALPSQNARRYRMKRRTSAILVELEEY